MTGIGVVILFFGYVIMYWAYSRITGEKIAPFFTLLFPTGIKNPSVTPSLGEDYKGGKPG